MAVTTSAGVPESDARAPSGSAGRRSDLQGLRAVAVMAVIAYHFDIPWAPGGFVGVDIFFVLSGFFITCLLVRDVEAHGRIRFARFWANRAKRLLPNGLLLILCVLVASVVLLPSYRLPGVSEDAWSAAAFYANFHFAAQAVDYFHLDDPPSPLLHYWSLAVEEQFYVVLPVLIATALVLTRTTARAAVLVLLSAAAIVSLAASLIVIEDSQPDAFFHPQYRAWQLALGGLAGLLFESRGRLPEAIRAAGAIAGALAVAASIVLLRDDLSYPGAWALAPSLGTAGVILGLDAGRSSQSLGRALSLPPLVAVGDMSYSLYLWHWPVAVFLGELSLADGAAGVVLGLAITALLASAAYYLVERPIHHMALPEQRLPRVLATGATAVAMVAAAALGASVLPGRSDPSITSRIAEATADLGPNYKNGCHLRLDGIDQPDCRFAVLGGPRVVLFGDSHAAQWFTALVKAGEQAGWEVNAWSKTGCPSFDVAIWYPPARSVYEECATWRNARLRSLIDDPPDLVILGNSSRYYGWVHDVVRDGPADRARAEKLWHDAIQETVNMLLAAGVAVVELRDTPKMYAGYRNCLSAGDWDACHRARGEALDGMQGPSIAQAGYSKLDLSDVLCERAVCRAAAGGRILYRDSEHITASHAESHYRHFVELLEGSRARHEPAGGSDGDGDRRAHADND